MFGIRFIKVQPTTHLLQFKDGKIARSGPGLAFFYNGPTSPLVAVPLASTDAPFIFNEVTADFQEVTIQGQVTYGITDPVKISQLIKLYFGSCRQKLRIRRSSKTSTARNQRHEGGDAH
jgi:hypothetical protein